MDSSPKHILLTGSSGFVGKRFVEYNNKHYTIHSVSLRTTKVADIEWKKYDTIVHMAGKAHQMEKIDDQVYFDVNYELTKQLADRAKQERVPHFLFVSTIKVWGDAYKNAHLKIDTPCVPDDAYGKSKLQAENYLQEIKSPDFKVAIVRPPLVYGPGVKGNMIRFMKLAANPLPLPFGGIDNQRTMVFLDNLIELFNTIIDQKAEGIFLAGDKSPLSTSSLIESIQLNLKEKTGLFKLPGFAISILNFLKPELIKRLFYSLTIDTIETNKQLSFSPPFTSEYGIQQMVSWYKQNPKG